MSTRHRQATTRGGALATAPWRRAPILLLRQPVVFLALVGAAAILAIAAASGPLFLSTVGTASLHAQAEQRCPEASRPTVTAAVPRDQIGTAAAAGVAAFARHGLPGAYSAADGYSFIGASLVHLYSRSGALDHVRTLTPRTGTAGVWLPKTFASKFHAGPGGTITTAGGVALPVAGIYQDLAPDPYALSHLPRYWCSITNQIVATVASDGAIAATPPQLRQGALLIADSALVGRASAATVQLTWSRPMSTITSPLSRFDSAQGRAAAAASSLRNLSATADPDLAQLTGRAHQARAGISGSIVPIEIAGVIVAGLLVGGAGLFWATARQREIRLLVARGVGPIPLAGKAILETAGPAVIGAGLGLVGAVYLVRAVGPARTLEPDAPLRALLLVVGTLLLGLLAIGVIGGLSGRDRTAGRRASWVRVVPWEVILLAAAGGLALTNQHRSAVTIDHTIVRIGAVVVLYPLLGATAVLVLVGRVVGLLLPAVGRSAGRWRTTAYLALRRLSRSRAIVIGLIVGTALPCCLLMYGSTVTDTVSHEVRQKYQTNLGAPHVLQIYGVHSTLVDPDGHGTQVVSYTDTVALGAGVQAGGTSADVLGVDTATFNHFAFVDPDQRAAVRRLAHPTASGPLPAILVNAAGAADTRHLHIGNSGFTLRPVATAAAFPGLRDSTLPMVVVDQRALARVDTTGDRQNQLWTDNAQYAAARRLIAAHGFSLLFELTAQVVVDNTGLLPVTWLFGYLRALAVLIGVVAIAGLVFGLAARTRRRRVSYVLSRRMGLSKGAHLTSLLVELTLVIGLGWLAGSAFGVSAFELVYRRFDVYPQLKPPPAFTIPSAPLVVTAAISVAIVLVASVATQLLAERTKPAEILRLE